MSLEIILGIFLLGGLLTFAVIRLLPKKAPAAGGAGTPTPASATPTATSAKAKSESSILLPLVILAALCGIGALWFFFPESVESALRTFDAHWSLPLGLAITVALIVLSFFLPEKAKKWTFGAGVAVLFLSLVNSDLGTWAARQVDQVERCLSNNDCGPRAGDYNVIRGGTVLIPRGRAKTFYIEGTVALENNSTGYCLDYSPKERFMVESVNGGRVNYFTPISGERELISVRSLPRDECYL